MARRTFTVIDVVEVLQHWHAGRPKSVVASSLGVDDKTVRKYVAKAEAAGMVPGGPPLSRAEWAELVAGWFPQLVDARARSLTWPEIDRHRQLIGEMVKTNTVTTVHQRLRDELDLRAGITSVRRYVASEFPAEAARDKVTVLRPPVAPGEEAQIDYGLLGSWLDPVAERVRRVWAFIMVLACSRHMFVRPVLSMDERSWVAAHVAAAEFFGGLPRRLVPDNLKTGVTRPGLYDPLINRAYGEFAAHYGVLIDPARASKPKDKPRVERQVPFVRDSFWRGREWTDEAAMQAAALVWCTEVARPPFPPLPRWGQPAGGVPRRRGRRPGGVAGDAVRVGPLVPPEGGRRLPHPGRASLVFGAVAAHRRPRRRPPDRPAGRRVRRRRRCEEPRA